MKSLLGAGPEDFQEGVLLGQQQSAQKGRDDADGEGDCVLLVVDGGVPVMARKRNIVTFSIL